MPTPEEIKKLSDAYAEYMCPVGDYCGGVYDDQRNSDLPIYKDDAKSVLEWLSERFCIVEKNKLQEIDNVVCGTFGVGNIAVRQSWEYIKRKLFEEEK